MKLSSWHKYALSLLTGILLTVSFPYTGSLYLLSFIAWIPLLLVEHDLYLKKEKVVKVFLFAFLAFFTYNSGANYWLYYSKGAGAIVGLAHVINALFMTLVFILFHITKRNLGNKWGMISLAILWVGFEFIHYNWELSTPWMTIGNLFSVAPEIVQWYSITGVLGGSLWILSVNIALSMGISHIIFNKASIKSQKLPLGLGVAFFIIPTLLSIWSYSTYKEVENPIEIIVTQPNTEQYKERKELDIKTQLDRLFDEADQLVTKNTAIVLGPETVIPNMHPVHEQVYQQDSAFRYVQIRRSQWNETALFMGLASYRTFRNKTRYTQTKFSSRAGYFEQYDASVYLGSQALPKFIHKSKLLLMAEKIPFAKKYPWLEKYAVNLRGTKGTLGSSSSPEVVRANGFTFAPVNCYESIYGEWVAQQCRKGADVIFAITNDGWWGDTPGYKQHASFSRLRAIENRRYVARSAMTGISFIINERGDISHATDFNVQTAFKADVQLNKKQTFYTANGDLIGRLFSYLFYFAIGLNIVYFLLNRLKRKAKKK